MNRGIARRTFFETKEDMGVFLEQLGTVPDRGELEVHAFALMTTHYHLLVRSPIGQLGYVLAQSHPLVLIDHFGGESFPRLRLHFFLRRS